MELGINWNFLGGILLVGLGPLIFYKSGIKLFFDTRKPEISNALSVFTSLANVTLYVCLSSMQHLNKAINNTEVKYLAFSWIVIGIYFLIGILFSNSFNGDIVEKKIEELKTLKHLESLGNKSTEEIKQKLVNLSRFFLKHTILQISCVFLYLIFFMFISIALVKSEFY